MRTGTKSVLFGVHAFWWHPFTVLAAWIFYHGRWPNTLAQWVAIFCHDLGYWGRDNIDGKQGRSHPAQSADFVWRLWFLPHSVRSKAARIILGHSKHYAKKWDWPVSDLYAPDKLSVLFDPDWFYIFRATLSGEIHEYINNSPVRNSAAAAFFGDPRADWFKWYQAKVIKDFSL